MDAFRRILPLGRRGSRAVDYLLATLSDPRLLGEAVRHVLNRRRRRAESGRRAARRPDPHPPGALSAASLNEVLAGLAGRLHLLVLDRRPDGATVGVAEVEVLSALGYLVSTVPGLALSIADEPMGWGRGQLESLAPDAPQTAASFPGPGGVPVTLLIEPYRKDAPGRWISVNDRNIIARAVYADIFETPGITEAGDLLGGSTLEQIADARPIDVVYTWVNHADPHWQELYRAARAQGAANAGEASIDAENLARFHSKDELRYSLRSVAANLPWARRIHVLTNCARPDWLKADDPRLVWVRHEAVIPSEYLPTFNSHVIESYLHRLPDLAEHFVYVNDDVFIMKPLAKAHFFNANGTSRIQFEPYAMVGGPVHPGDADHLNASRNSARLIKSRFGHVATQLHRHVPFALRLSILTEIEAAFAETFAEFRRNRFRRSNDVNLTSFLYHHYALATREATLADCTSMLVKSHDIRWRVRLAEAAEGDLEVVCINEGGDMRSSSIWEANVAEFMQAAFPGEAPWEA